MPDDAVRRDDLLTNVMFYWLNGTAASSARYYREGIDNTWGELEPESPMPTAVAVLPRDIALPVRRLAERNHTIVHWTEMERGGHFGAMEVPYLMSADLRAAFRPYRAA